MFEFNPYDKNIKWKKHQTACHHSGARREVFSGFIHHMALVKKRKKKKKKNGRQTFSKQMN